jgi:hypothetical protein
MIRRNDVLSLYQLILDRDPESEEVIGEKRNAASLSELASEMLTSAEFVTNNAGTIAAGLGRDATL